MVLQSINHRICCHSSACNFLTLLLLRKYHQFLFKLSDNQHSYHTIPLIPTKSYLNRLTAAGYLCYRSIHRIIYESHRIPWRDELLKMSPQLLSIVVLLVFLTVVMLKAYAIGIVWRCYKYLTMRQHNIRSMLPYIIPEISARQVKRKKPKNNDFIWHLIVFFLSSFCIAFRNVTTTPYCRTMRKRLHKA